MPYRLTQFSHREIQQLLKKARIICQHNSIDIKAAPVTTLPGRLLIILPKKIGHAPMRNLMRRRIKAIFYEEKLYEKSYDFIFFCKPSITELEFNDLKEIMLSCISSKYA